MKVPPIANFIVYALLTVLCVVALWLVLNAPHDFLNAHVVYQGF